MFPKRKEEEKINITTTIYGSDFLLFLVSANLAIARFADTENM